MPIVLVESIPYPDRAFVAKRSERFTESNKTLRRMFQGRREQGDQQIYLVPGEQLLGRDGEATVDGVHPTDLGFMRMAEALQSHLLAIPGLIRTPAPAVFQPR